MTVRMRVFTVQYEDRAGVTQRVRVTAVDGEAAKQRCLDRGALRVTSVTRAIPADQIQPCC